MNQIKRIAASPPFQGYILSAYGPFANTSTPETLDNWIRNSVSPNWHGSGTVAIGKRGTNEGVLNPDFTVKGVKNLRVVDGSVFPFLLSAHIQAGIYAVSERAADLIKAAY